MHRPIQIQDYYLSFPHKTCFENFSTVIEPGDRIALIGRNGSGKSSLLTMIANNFPDEALAYIPQILEEVPLSGGECFHRSLSRALVKNPALLLLDEPTNHLDGDNRQSLFRKLQAYPGTLIIATHDKELLHRNIDILWHIEGGKVTIFRGQYEAYEAEKQRQFLSLTHQIEQLTQKQQSLHQALMQEQERAAKSRAAGKKKVATSRWMKSAGDLKAMKAEKSQGGKRKALDNKKQELRAQLEDLHLPEKIIPTFSLSHQEVGDRTLVHIVEGAVGYTAEKMILTRIHLSIRTRERVAIMGRNGSGKTTLLKGLLGDKKVIRQGEWQTPLREQIGILDQFYQNLQEDKTALEVIAEAGPSSWSQAEIRKHLNSFLFRKNEEVNTSVKQLSGGEKARLSLAQIAARPPRLLILDEITNNIDLETRNHVVDLLRAYPAAMIVVSHDEHFLKEIKIERSYAL
ncbi:MAG: ATP-binding cassette domain-containing protein [Holosporales bacterium]|nr:ATP-binding cassette domain-containing protein [Holosporales bacterium]